MIKVSDASNINIKNETSMIVMMIIEQQSKLCNYFKNHHDNGNMLIAQAIRHCCIIYSS